MVMNRLSENNFEDLSNSGKNLKCSKLGIQKKIIEK